MHRIAHILTTLFAPVVDYTSFSLADDLTIGGNLMLDSRAVAAAGSASTAGAGAVIYCTDGDAGSPCLAVSNGTNWLRVSLGAAISAT